MDNLLEIASQVRRDIVRMVKNTIQRYPMELQQLMKLKSKLNKQIKNHGKKPNE